MKKQFTNQKNQFKKTINNVIVLLMFLSLKAFSQTGAAIKLDGSGDLINLGAALTNSLNGGNKLTIEAWVNTATNSGGHGPIIGNHQTNAAGAFSFLLRRENAHHVFWVGNSTNQYATVSLNTSTLNTWIHLACVWNGTVASIYVNGALTASTTPALATLQNTVNHVYIGGAPLAGEHFNGMIDEVRIWNVARTKCEINTYKNCEIPNNSPGLLVNYHFNQGIAAGSNTTISTLSDASSNNLTGTLTAITLTGTASNWVAPGGVVSGSTTALAGPSYSATSLSVCSGNTISLTSTGATSFSWSPAITNSVAFTPTTSMGYTITNTNNVTSCSNTAVANVTVNALPTITVNTTNTVLCVGQTVTLTASGTSTSYVWNTSATGNSISVSPTITTNYTVTGTGLNNCVNKSVITQSVSLCTGINQTQNTGYNLSVFPNPSSTNLTIKTNDEIQIVSIYNSLGALVQTEKSNSFSVNQLAPGLYILNIKTENGTSIVRFIKE
ncbi:MAG: LamG-like jellyroll fold domain-containing protein [Bacteroidota bacterium]|nr:LamG-like jellyroll fold domain-containing protein [Bacteroidota bacterium]